MKAPVRLSISAPNLVRGGLESVLRPHQARVRVLPRDVTAGAHVEVDLERLVGPSRRDHENGLPRLAIIYDADVASRSKAIACGAADVAHLGDPVQRLLERIEHLARTHIETIRARDPETSLRQTIGLSGRERDVLALICLGYRNDEIGAELCVSINSIKTYIRSLYRKIEATNRAGAVRWGIAHGFGSDASTPTA